MGKSIIQTDKSCYFCGRVDGLERHHILGGVANRPLSEKYGLWVYLCHNCHTGTDGAQYDKEKNLKLKQDAQMCFQKYYSRQMWMRLFRKNYLGDWGKEE
jgi:hypothetical protein